MRFRFVGAALAVVALAGCATVETAADHVRDFTDAHPVAVSVVASVAIASLATTIELRRADKQLASQLEAALAGRQAPPTTVLHRAAE